jgi:hypothetical protein
MTLCPLQMEARRGSGWSTNSKIPMTVRSPKVMAEISRELLAVSQYSVIIFLKRKNHESSIHKEG